MFWARSSFSFSLLSLSTFLLLAGHIQPKSTYFQAAVTMWKNEWRIATFGSKAEYEQNKAVSDSVVRDMLPDFGAEVVVSHDFVSTVVLPELGEPI